MINIPVYYKDRDSVFDEEDSMELDIDSEGVFIACDFEEIRNFKAADVFLYQRETGTFFVEKAHKNTDLNVFSPEDVSIDYWRSFLTTIFEETETIKNAL
jgi:hypothetical protein